jgi:hypothetical protein
MRNGGSRRAIGPHDPDMRGGAARVPAAPARRFDATVIPQLADPRRDGADRKPHPRRDLMNAQAPRDRCQKGEHACPDHVAAARNAVRRLPAGRRVASTARCRTVRCARRAGNLFTWDRLRPSDQVGGRVVVTIVHGMPSEFDVRKCSRVDARDAFDPPGTPIRITLREKDNPFAGRKKRQR